MFRAILAERSNRTFYLSNVLATLADYVLYLVLGVWTKLLTGSTGLAGVTFLLLLIGTLTVPVTSLLIDCFNRLRVLIATYCVTAAIVLSLVFVNRAAELWLIYVVALLYGASGALNNNASAALRPALVSEELLTAANGAMQSVNQGLRIVAPVLGVGVLTIAGGRAVACVSCALFVLASATMARVRLETSGATSGFQSRWLAAVRDGSKYLFAAPSLRNLTIALALAMLAFGVFETVAIQIVTVGLHKSASWIGFLTAAQGAGGVFGGILTVHLSKKLRESWLVILGLAVVGGLCALVAVPNVFVVVAAAGAIGLALPLALAGQMTIFQKGTPSGLLGRVLGAAALGAQVPQAAGIAAGARLVDELSYRTLLLWNRHSDLCVCCLLGADFAASFRGSRRQAWSG